ncbi:hypothetical protein [Geodermatophilus chilensis]|uniref:hypothetical protein n=1 Tax=Geodermatophilus chilensis TaxID=2035835 RepID=UPI000C2604B0|nr:hypothetical protein [Geodermatophilus chilensis]
MDTRSPREHVRWWLIGVFAALGLVSAVAGVWWSAASTGALAVAQLVSIAHDRRRSMRHGSRPES